MREQDSPTEDGTGPFPLTSPQVVIWLDLLAGENSAEYNLCDIFRFDGALDVAALIHAIERSHQEADAYRLRFSATDGAPGQVVGGATVDIAVLDLTNGGVGEGDLEAFAHAEIEALLRRPLKLEEGRSSRYRIIRLAPDRHWWVRIVHHLAIDALGGMVQASRVAEIYNARLRGEEPPVSWLGSYRDFIAADAAYPGSEAHAKDVAYWRARLAGQGRPIGFSSRKDAHRGWPRGVFRPLASNCVAGLDRVAARAGVSRQAVLLAAYLLLLGRCADTETPICAMPMLNRRGRAERATVGTFTAVVPFGVSLDDSSGFVDLARAVARQLRGDLRHMRLAGGHMRAAGLDPWQGRDRRVATFNAIDYQPDQAFGGVRATVAPIAHGPVDDVMLIAIDYRDAPEGDETVLRWVYNSSAHDEASVRRLAARFEALLDAVVADPERELADLPTMGDEEAAVIAGWESGSTLPETAARECVHDLVLAQAVRTPQAPAVIAGGRAMTYGDLASLTARVAARLVDEGVGPEEPVGLCLSPSAELVSGFLGILAAGGASLQLDPQLPMGRLEAMIRGVGCRLVLTDSENRQRFSALTDLRIIGLDDPEALGGEQNDGQPKMPPPGPEALACIFHTSGSTGHPKPVGLEHGTLAARMLSMADFFGFGAGDECSCVTSSIGFDPWLQQVLMPLCTGGRIWMPGRDRMLDPAGFWRALKDEGITHLNAVPSMLDSLLPGIPADCGLALRRVVVGGERLTPGTVNGAAGAVEIGDFWNMYGPTEATVDATGWRVDIPASGEEIPVGSPLPGCVVRILDDRGQRVPIGSVGEICIGGAGLARGYLGMPEETAGKFIVDPFGPPGTRLYRTGDRAIWRDDGALLFRGRADDQVKVRGQRIELGDVESVLLRQPNVEAGVVLFEPTGEGGRLTAHVVGRTTADALRGALAHNLPGAAVPARYVFHDALPVLPSGKVDRRALAREIPATTARPAATGGGLVLRASVSGRRLVLQRRIAAVWADLLEGEAPPLDANLFEAGVHSLLVPRAQPRLSALAGREVSAVEVFRYPTIASLAAHLAGIDPAEPGAAPTVAPERAAGEDDNAVAVVGMALRVPGADDPAVFWRNLVDGVESIGRVDAAALRAAGLDEALLDDPSFVASHGRIDGIETFDPAAFGYTLGEAAIIDPQQRLLLEVSLHALEDAACDPARDGPVGAFVGVGTSSYLHDNLGSSLRGVGAERYAVTLNNDKDHAATRLAYKLGLTGPAVAVGTACSTGLVAVVQAVQALRTGQCRAALAGGASLGLSTAGGYLYDEGGIGSRSGRCRPFDADADGTVGGSGAAIVVLKRLSDALADGDAVHAVIRGIGLGNDGSAKASFTAPTVSGQAMALAAALTDADVEPSSVGFVEGHGTGTALGDPIEVEALNQAYGPAAPGSALLGSLKGNIGHLDSAAGIVGLIKAVLAVREGKVPPTCNFQHPNPGIAFGQGPFRVNDRCEPWPQGDGLRRAAVSSFGVGGTNAHVIVEQGPAHPAPEEREQTPEAAEVLVLSAADDQALDRLAESVAGHLRAAEVPDLADVAHSLQVGRRRMRRRCAVIAGNHGEAVRGLSGEGRIDGESSGGAVSVAFLFPGQGTQYPGMGKALYDQEPAFRAAVDAAADVLAGTGAADLRDLLLGDPDDKAAAARLAGTALTQPALFVTEYGIARVLQDWGIRPDALAGHSVGEYVAACLSGVMPFATALSLVAERGRLMGSAPTGAMLALSMPETEARSLIAAEVSGDGTILSLAAVNGPRQCVAAGSEDAIAALQRRAEAEGRPAHRLNVSHAFHCALMDPILGAFEQKVAEIPLAEPEIPFLSNLTGTWITAAEATDPAYWARHLRGTVRFADNLAALATEPGRILVETGPGATLSRLARANGFGEAATVATQPAAGGGRAALLETVARLWVRGVEPEWERVTGGRPARKVPLPGYPYQRVRAWVDPQAAPRGAPIPVPESPKIDVVSGSLPEATDAIVEAWKEVFGSQEIGADTDFFALGGDSMIALRIVSLLRDRFGWKVSVNAVLSAGTASGLAETLAEHHTTPRTERMETGII